jgi:hypothetical protein
LDFELVDAVAESEFFEGRGAFGEQNQVEGIIGPVGKRDFDGKEAEFWESGERGAVYICGRRLLHPGRKVAHTQALNAGVRIKIEQAGDAGHIASVWAGDGF